MLTALAAAVGLGGATLLRHRAWSSVEMVDLLGRAGGPTSAAEAVNNDGIIVGAASGRGFRHDGTGFTWLTPLHIGSEAAAVDASGTAVGSYWSTDLSRMPGYWTLGGTTRGLVVPAGHGGQATGAAVGIVVGTVWSSHGSPLDRAWVWSADTNASPTEAGQPLPTPRGSQSFAHGVSPTGVVSGTVLDGGHRYACIWDLNTAERTHTILADLGGRATSVEAVSDRGLAVGWAEDATGSRHACAWDLTTSNPVCVRLKGLEGAVSAACAVNSAGVIVGWSTSSDHKRRACTWAGTTSAAVDLGTLGGDTSAALGINDHNVVVGSASTGAGAVGLPLRPGGWSWEDRAFRHVLNTPPR